jgi:hypothetical protein
LGGHAFRRAFRFDQRTLETVRQHCVDADAVDFADEASGSIDMDRLQIGTAADGLILLSNKTGMTRPSQDALKDFCCAVSNSCNAARRVAFTSSGICLAAVDAGVPGRGLYLNEKAWA